MKNRRLFTLVVALFSIMVLAATGCQSNQGKTEATEKRQYSFWPPAPDEPRIQFLRAMNSSADVTPAQSHMDEVMYGKEQVLAIVKPYGVAMWQSKVYVCDVRSKGVTVLDFKQHLAKAVAVGGSIEVAKASDIAIAPDGMKYVVDIDKHCIVVMDTDDKAALRFASKDMNPASVAVYGEELYVADSTALCIKVLNRATGAYIRSIGEPGDGDGQFLRPLCVRVDPTGVVFADDVMLGRVMRFTRDGKFLSAFGQPGNLPGDLVRPKHFSFDKLAYVYIADAAFNNVQVFDEHQKVAGYFGSAGTHPGAMELPAGVFVDESPEDIAVFQKYVHPAFQAERLILVANQFGPQRVSVYAGGRLKPGKTVADIAPSRAKISLGTTATTGPTTQPDFMPVTPTTQAAPK